MTSLRDVPIELNGYCYLKEKIQQQQQQQQPGGLGSRPFLSATMNWLETILYHERQSAMNHNLD